MLVLSRKKGQRIVVGGSVTVTVLECHGGTVRLGFEAPDHVEILREEVMNEFRAAVPATDGPGRKPFRKG